MKFLSLIILCCTVFSVSANVNHIDISRITKDETLIAGFNDIKSNLPLYDHLVPQWDFPQKKEDIQSFLSSQYTAFAEKGKKGAELELLLGDICHYLYNLETDGSFENAAIHFEKAQKLSPNDYRVYWFSAFSQSLATYVVRGYEEMEKARLKAPDKAAAAFWDEYAYVSLLADMPSHCLLGMNEAKKAAGEPQGVETNLGGVVESRFLEFDPKVGHTSTEMWDVIDKEKPLFTNRALGVSFETDSVNGLELMDFDNGQAAFIISPPAVVSSKKKEIGFNMLMIARIVGDDEKLEDFADLLTSGSPAKRSKFPVNYKNALVYEVVDKDTYPNWGGGHSYMIFIERTKPEIPGLALESPARLPVTEKLEFFEQKQVFERVDGKIFYMFLLDTCEEIRQESLKTFTNFMENELIIE